MAVLGGRFSRARGQSARGRFYVRENRGQLVIQGWPRKQSQKTKEKNRQLHERFKQSQQLIPYIIPEQQRLSREAVKGTPLLPRDLLTAAIYGRLWSINLTDGRRLNSVAAASDVSQNLDIIGQVDGDILVRGDQAWQRLPIGNPGQVITIDASGNIIWGQGGGAVTQLKVGTFSRTLGQPASNQVITGVGFKPLGVAIIGAVGGTTVRSTGFGDGTTQLASFQEATAGAPNVTAGGLIIDVKNGGNAEFAILASLDADGFTLSWAGASGLAGTFSAAYLAIA